MSCTPLLCQLKVSMYVHVGFHIQMLHYVQLYARKSQLHCQLSLQGHQRDAHSESQPRTRLVSGSQLNVILHLCTIISSDIALLLLLLDLVRIVIFVPQQDLTSFDRLGVGKHRNRNVKPCNVDMFVLQHEI